MSRGRFKTLHPAVCLAFFLLPGFGFPTLLFADESESSEAVQAVLVTGYTLKQVKGSPSALPIQTDDSANSEDRLSQALTNLGIVGGSEISEQAMAAAERFLNEVRPADKGVQREAFASLYQPCMISTSTALSRLSFRIPADSKDAIMEHWDSSRGEAYSVTFLQPADDNPPDNSASWVPDFKLNPDKGVETLLGMAATKFIIGPDTGEASETLTEVSQSPDVEPVPATDTWQPGLGSIAVAVHVANKGNAWVASEFDGSDIVRNFSDSFRAHLVAKQDPAAFYAETLNEVFGLLQHGLPLRVTRVSESFVGSSLMNSTSTESITSSLQLISGHPVACSESTIPQGYQLSNTQVVQ